jgi:hypothetical protein
MKRAPEKKLIITNNEMRDTEKSLSRWPNISCMDLFVSVTRNKFHDETTVLKCFSTNFLQAGRKYMLLIYIACLSQILRTIRYSRDFKSINNIKGSIKTRFSV